MLRKKKVKGIVSVVRQLLEDRIYLEGIKLNFNKPRE